MTEAQKIAKAARAKARRAAKKSAPASAPAKAPRPVACRLEGEDVRIGDFVGFKDGIEQSGKLIRVSGDSLILSCWDSDVGERFERTISRRNAWLEAAIED